MLPELHRQQIAPLGMKSLGGGGDAVKKQVVRVEDALRYAMSLPVATTISGIDSMRVLRQNVRIASDFTPLSTAQMERSVIACRRHAADGRFELYKTTAKHEGDVGRQQHGFPAPDALGA